MKDTVDSAKAAPRQSANPTDARETLRTFWNARYAADEFAYGTAPNEFLVQMAPNFARQGRLEPFGASRQALHFGQQKINLHERGREFEPKAQLPVPGALDLCFIVGQTFEAVIAHVRACGWPIVEWPVERTGATGRLRSIYLRDPDLNLLELSELLSPLSD